MDVQYPSDIHWVGSLSECLFFVLVLVKSLRSLQLLPEMSVVSLGMSLWQRFTHRTQLQNVVTGKRQFMAWRYDLAGIHIGVCSQQVPRESCLELGEQKLTEARAERVPVGFTVAYVLRHLPSPFFALEVSSCDHPMTHRRAGSVLLMLASPRAPNCRLKLMVSGHTLHEAFAFILGEDLLSNRKWPNWLAYGL